MTLSPYDCLLVVYSENKKELVSELCRSLDWKMVGLISRALSQRFSPLPIFIPTMEKLSARFVTLLEVKSGDLDKLVASYQGMNIKNVGVLFSEESLKSGWNELSERLSKKLSSWTPSSSLSLNLIESGSDEL